MSRQLIKAIFLALLSLVLSLSNTSARPAAINVRAGDLLPPNLSDTLAVAKSPLEPVTLALTLPDVARTDEQPLETTKVLSELDFTTASTELSNGEEKRTTRSAQSFFEQQSSSTTMGLGEGAGLGGAADTGSTQSVATETPEESTGATEASTETPTESDKSGENESATTLTPASSESSSTSQESTTTTTSPEPVAISDATTNATTTTTTVAEEPMVTTTKEPETTTAEASTTTLAPSTTPSTTTTETSTTITEAPTTTTSEAPTTVNSGSSSSTSAENTNLRENEQPKEVTEEPATTTTTTTLAPSESTEAQPDTTTTNQPTESAESTTTPTTSSSADVEREQPVSSTEAAPSTTTEGTTENRPSPTPETPESTTTAATTTTTSPSQPPPTTTNTTTTTPQATTNQTTAQEPKLNKEEDMSSCDHLPTYDTDEIQKVFREETTFKNGTIKGKFTYINFDQRYRLVHYTRLPYGPVKIDRVEELGKPNRNETNQTSSAAAPNLSDVPNAVLQLRNLLPNSLFGFPFLGPNNGARAQSPFVNPKENGATNGNDESNMYFYSTDSLSTPNLFNSRVPVSLLPGQRIKSAQATAAPSSLSSAPADARNSFFGLPSDKHQHSPGFGMPNPQDDYSKQLNKLDESLPPTPLRSDPVVPPTSNQFRYSNPFGPTPPTPSTEKGMVFSYYTSHAHPAHYQYTPSSSSIYQPYPLRIHHTPMMASPSIEGLAGQHQQLQHHHAQAHQPHGHEHYMAPFMFAQPVEHQSQQDAANNDGGSSRLRLKVKTSKALNINQVGGTKSAQLRSDGHYSNPTQLESPAKVHQRSQQRQQQRLGKQNHQLLRPGPQSNPSPVVYHVLRNNYNHQYDQGYAMAYDHDN